MTKLVTENRFEWITRAPLVLNQERNLNINNIREQRNSNLLVGSDSLYRFLSSY